LCLVSAKDWLKQRFFPGYLHPNATRSIVRLHDPQVDNTVAVLTFSDRKMSTSPRLPGTWEISSEMAVPEALVPDRRFRCRPGDRIKSLPPGKHGRNALILLPHRPGEGAAGFGKLPTRRGRSSPGTWVVPWRSQGPFRTRRSSALSRWCAICRASADPPARAAAPTGRSGFRTTPGRSR
jgi:hypothetical protein